MKLGILVGGAPAPGINSAISAATIEAVNQGLQVIGIFDGYEHLAKGRTDMVRPLTIADVSRIHHRGGSILRTSRTSITARPEDTRRTVSSLLEMGIRYLVLIGGDGTASSALELVRASRGEIRIAQVPKTIDNDLPLPGGLPTFGFETARHLGTELVLNLMEDSLTTNRWYFVVAMGRTTGHLALGIGKAAGATLTVIPEEFPQGKVTLDMVCRVLEGSILKRRIADRRDGVAVIAEGIAGRLEPQELLKTAGVKARYDSQGHIRLGEIPLATMLRREVERRFAARGEDLTIVDVTLGYELRSAPPIPFDIDYTRTLGYGAVRFLLSEPQNDRLRHGGLVCLENGHLNVLSFEDLRDPSTGRSRSRKVDICSDHYNVARQYMIRLERQDLAVPAVRDKLAQAANMSGEEFDRAFAPVVGLEPGEAPDYCA